MAKITVSEIIKSSIVTAFVIAAALIWKDVIEEVINVLVPVGDQLFYKFIAAVIATILIVIAIYIILKAQKETEVVLRRLKTKKRKK